MMVYVFVIIVVLLIIMLYGGAIYNNGSLVLQNCSFANNIGYGGGNDVANIGYGIVMIDGKIINGSDGPVKHLNKDWNLKLIIIGALATVISFIPGFVGAAMQMRYFFGVLSFAIGVNLGRRMLIGIVFPLFSSFVIGAVAGTVAGAGIGTGASFIASSITGVEVTSLLEKYIPISIASGIAGAIIGVV